MSDMVKHLEQMAKDIDILRGDVIKMAAAKKKEQDRKAKDIKEEKPFEESAKDTFKKVSLSSLQQGTHLYKNKEEIKQANAHPELDFVNRRLSSILNK